MGGLHSNANSAFAWPEREDSRGDKPGYHEFFRSRTKTSETHDWEPFLDAVTAQFGDDNLKASIEKATAEKSTTEELKNLPAIFELAVVHPSRPKQRVKCFVGKCMDFQHASREILNDPNHYLTKFLRLALQHGNSVVRRYVRIRRDTDSRLHSVAQSFPLPHPRFARSTTSITPMQDAEDESLLMSSALWERCVIFFSTRARSIAPHPTLAN